MRGREFNVIFFYSGTQNFDIVNTLFHKPYGEPTSHLQPLDIAQMQHGGNQTAWTADRLGGKRAFVRELNALQITAILNSLARCREGAPEKITRDDFADPAICSLMGDVRRDLIEGRGAVILSGLDISGMPLEDFARIFWGLGTFVGVGAPQSNFGDRICVVRNDHRANSSSRGYLRNIELRPHTDFHEVLALAAFRTAAHGGESGLSSSLTVHDIVQRECPEHLRPLYEGFYEIDPETRLVREEKSPFFSNVDGVLSCYLHSYFHECAADQLGVSFPEAIIAAQAFVHDVAMRPQVRLKFLLEQGEMFFWHNFSLLHSRMAFTDSPTQSRVLLRLWLHVTNGRAVHPSFNRRAQAIDRGHDSGQIVIDYN